MTEVAISVALCTRNGARYLPEQLASIAAQTLPVTEIVLGDDASTDATLEIARRFADESGIQVHVRAHAEPLGVRDNFSDAVAHTAFDVVALADQDDVWHPERLERLVPHLATADLVHSDARLVDAGGRPLGRTLAESLEMSAWERERLAAGDALAVFLRRNLVTGATTLVRRESALRALPVPEGWIHDEWFGIVAAIEGRVAYVPEALTDYRQHGANQIGVRSLSLREKLGRLVERDSGSHERKALRATSLAAEAARRGLGTPELRERLTEKARHERTRAALPDARIRRVPAVARGVVRGRYSSYSRGLLDIGRDLLESH